MKPTAVKEYFLNKKHLNTLLLSIAEAENKGHKIKQTIEEVLLDNGAAFFIVRVISSQKTAIILNAFFNINYIFFNHGNDKGIDRNNIEKATRKN
jgi:hypothetical protein